MIQMMLSVLLFLLCYLLFDYAHCAFPFIVALFVIHFFINDSFVWHLVSSTNAAITTMWFFGSTFTFHWHILLLQECLQMFGWIQIGIQISDKRVMFINFIQHIWYTRRKLMGIFEHFANVGTEYRNVIPIRSNWGYIFRVCWYVLLHENWNCAIYSFTGNI